MSIQRIAPVLRLLGGLLVLLTLVGVVRAEVSLTHVHGLAYSADGARLQIPSHHGLAVYEDGKWSTAAGPRHDYMGFAATRERLYSSGHPAPGSGLVNPFGLIRSDDGGKSWKTLGLEGESDFHLLAASFETNAIYVLNHAPNSRMKTPGIYYTTDDGAAWKQAAGAGLTGDRLGIAVHPRDPRVVAMGTRDGLYLSTDSAESFRRLASGQALAVFFDLDGEHLWFAGHDGAASLKRMNWGAGTATQVKLPALGDDAILHVAQNPVRRDEYAIATFKLSVYVSRDGGASWDEIARKGKGLERPTV